MSIQKLRERTTFFLVLGIFAALAVNLNFLSFRLDLTSSGSFSISQASKDVVAQAKENISITYYLSKKLRTFNPVFDGLADFMDEYAAVTGGKVKLRVVDPQDTGEVQDLQRIGIAGTPINVVEESQQTQTVVYSGVLIQYLDRQEVLPVVQQLESLEYDLTSHINKLITKKTKTIGLLIGDASKTLQNDYRYLSDQLGKQGTVKTIGLNEAITNDVNVLIVAGDKTIDEATAFRIDQYLMNGGKVLFAADGVWVDLGSNQNPAQVVPENNPLLKNLQAYGVKVEPAFALDAYNHIVQFNSPQGPTLRRYPYFLQILAQNTDKTNPVTSRFSGLSLLWTSPLEDLKKPNLQTTALVSTSDKSWLMKDNLTIDPDQGAVSAQMPGADPKKRPVVFALSGSFSSAYDAATLPNELKSLTASAPLVSKSSDTRAIVVGSSVFLTDLIKNAFNIDENVLFVQSAVDWLAQDEALLSIKNRSFRDKSLTLLQDASIRQGAAIWLSLVNLGIIPLVILVWGVVHFVLRSKREQKS